MNTTTVLKSVRNLAFVGVAAALTGGLFSAASNAGTPAVTRSATVKFGELDLTRPAGVAELYRRINRAANLVCGPAEHFTAFALRQSEARCKQQAVVDAVRKINNPNLIAMHGDAQRKSVPYA